MKTRSNLQISAEWALNTARDMRGMDRIISCYSNPSIDQVFMDIKETALSGKTALVYYTPISELMLPPRELAKDPIPKIVRALKKLGYVVEYAMGELRISWVKVE